MPHMPHSGRKRRPVANCQRISTCPSRAPLFGRKLHQDVDYDSKEDKMSDMPHSMPHSMLYGLL